jgi:Yip1 domain
MDRGGPTMSMTGDTNAKMTGLVARIKGILLTPDAEWAVIDTEPATIASLYTGYIVILAAIGPIATFLRGQLFGYGAFGITWRPPIIGAVSSAIVSYLLALVGAFVMALIIDVLAPTFQGQKNQVQALKLVAYGSTASWLAGIFGLIPGFGLLGLLGLYSAYLFYKGLPVIMKSPADKSIPYLVVVIVVAIVLAIVISPITALLIGNTMPAIHPAYGSM